MEIKPYKNGFAVYKDGHWCTWATTLEFAERWAKEWDKIPVEKLPFYSQEI